MRPPFPETLLEKTQISGLNRAALATAVTLPWPGRQTAPSRQRSFTGADPCAVSMQWNTPHWNARTGSALATRLNPSGASPRERPRQTSTPLPKDHKAPPNQDKPTSTKTDKVHFIRMTFSSRVDEKAQTSDVRPSALPCRAETQSGQMP